VHEVAQQADPAARVVYADIDPVAIAHSKVILDGNDNAAVIDADLREPEKILDHEAVARLIRSGEPTGLLLVAVLHFISDADDPWNLVTRLRDALAPGSYLVLSHMTATGDTPVVKAFEKAYNRTVSTPIRARPPADILRFFDGFELVDPGLVYVPLWRPDSPADVPEDPSRFGNLVGVARKA
jgi:hypothetical protein